MANSMKEYDFPSWITNAKAWNQPTLNNVVLPGIVQITKKIGPKLRVEKNKASGSDGGGSLIKGLENPEFVFELKLRTGTEEQKWTDLVAMLLPAADPRKRKAFPVYHPSLARYRIVSCIVEEVSEVPALRGGFLQGYIHCIATYPVKNGATKAIRPKPSSPSSPSTVPLNTPDTSGPRPPQVGQNYPSNNTPVGK